ncbi:YdcF family protein [Nocardia sp. CDC160]|uniref:YdcF family protein n=1 Tax=Nocardia sp. CDC160 TaxID=3112166 RepID=UPI002DBCF2F8|nr:YdcF family protein [Nocardia sp. CDC160]MEC3920607.1 YdcF family protein [Nocardia sp. CDC160]
MPALRKVIAAVVVVTALIVGLAFAGLPVYVHPQVDPLRPADAIVVLGGTAYARYDLGLQLAQEGYAPELLISRSTGQQDAEMNRYCDGGYSFTVYCFVPDPWTTQGEAEEIARRAQAGHWRHIIVVTYTPHVSRARYIVEKCFHGQITMVASPSDSGLAFWTWMYIRQSAGYVRAFLQRGC